VLDLRETIGAVRHDGRNRDVRCPAHDDRRSSLSVGLGKDGRILLRCHVGCEPSAILDAAGLTWADLHDRSNADNSTKREIAAVYDYVDESGIVLYQVVRFEPKDFRQRCPDVNGWTWSTKGLRPVLYHLDQIQQREMVIVAEGEKDVDRLRGLGLSATCNHGGAGKWKPEHTQQLVSSGVTHVVVIPDADEPGRKHAENVARSCASIGLTVKVVDLPAKDASAWLDAGGTKDDLAACIQAAPVYQPTADASRLTLTSIGDLLAEPDETVDWLVEDCIPAGGTVIVAAKPKVGKSTTARDLALAVARGEAWLGYPDARPIPCTLSLSRAW